MKALSAVTHVLLQKQPERCIFFKLPSFVQSQQHRFCSKSTHKDKKLRKQTQKCTTQSVVYSCNICKGFGFLSKSAA